MLISSFLVVEQAVCFSFVGENEVHGLPLYMSVLLELESETPLNESERIIPHGQMLALDITSTICRSHHTINQE